MSRDVTEDEGQLVRTSLGGERYRPPRCPSCGWHLVPLEVDPTDASAGWAVICPNPNWDDGKLCGIAWNHAVGARVVEPGQAVYR